MEPFRPLVDLSARAIAARNGPEVTPEAKRHMADLIALDFTLAGESSSVSVALSCPATSLAQSFEARRLSLALPEPHAALTLAGLGA